MAVRSRAGDVAGAMVVAHPRPNRFSANEEQLLADIAAQAGIVLDIARLFRAAEVEIDARRRAEEVQRFYAETSAVLSLSLDYPESFEQLGPALRPVPRRPLPDRRRRRARRPAVGGGARRSRRRRRSSPSSRRSTRPIRTARIRPRAWCAAGRPEVAGEMSDDFLRTTTRDERHFEIVKELDFTSYMCVPLQARGRVLGALTLVSSGSGRRFGDADLALAVEFARRAGLALDNARLYSERDHVARALQSSLLPPSLPDIPGARVTARYRAAGEGNEVGGDFYHVFQVDEHAWWFVIGDVSGKGPEAAAIAGLARHTLRALGLQERSPSQLAHAPCTRRCSSAKATASSARCAARCCSRPSSGATLSIACGGHPPPIIRRADGARRGRDVHRPAARHAGRARRSSSTSSSSGRATSSCSTPTASPKPTTGTSSCSARSGSST